MLPSTNLHHILLLDIWNKISNISKFFEVVLKKINLKYGNEIKQIMEKYRHIYSDKNLRGKAIFIID